MEQGKLSVTKSRKGVNVKLLFEGKKGQTALPIQNSGITDTALDGKDVEFERVKGQVQKIVLGGDGIYEKGDPARSAPKRPAPSKPHRQAPPNTPHTGPSGMAIKRSEGGLDITCGIRIV